MHVQNDHEKSPHNLFNIETIETEGEEIFKCSECEFKTTHNPGLKSHMTKMHGIKVKHSCVQCSETFETRKKLKMMNLIQHWKGPQISIFFAFGPIHL